MKGERATANLVDFCHTNLRFRKNVFLGFSLENLKLLIWSRTVIQYTDPTVIVCGSGGDFKGA